MAELARTLPPGARVAVEEPGYQRAVGALRDAGLTVLAAPVDEAGLVVDALPPGLAAVYSTPAHQYPLGARLSAARRVALVERARVDGFLVVEDDYDGELRYDVAPLPLLAALGPDVVAHLGTASKLLTPTLGVGWLVAPPAVHAAVLDLRARTGARPARAGQRVFAALAAHGDLARHLRRLRRELAARRVAVLDAVTGGRGGVQGDAAGAHVVVPLPDAATERAVRAARAARGVALDGLARHHSGPAERTGLVLGYAGPRRADLQPALVVVTDALRTHINRRGVVRIPRAGSPITCCAPQGGVKAGAAYRAATAGSSGSSNRCRWRSACETGLSRASAANPGPGRISSSSGRGAVRQVGHWPVASRSVPQARCAKSRRGPRADWPRPSGSARTGPARSRSRARSSCTPRGPRAGSAPAARPRRARPAVGSAPPGRCSGASGSR